MNLFSCKRFAAKNFMQSFVYFAPLAYRQFHAILLYRSENRVWFVQKTANEFEQFTTKRFHLKKRQLAGRCFSQIKNMDSCEQCVAIK